MRLALLAVGRLRPACRDLCDDYLRRLSRYATVREIEVREAGRASSAALARRIEGDRLSGKLEPGSLVVALDRGGTAWDSEGLARQVDRWRTAARPVSILVGGPTGLDPGLLSRAAVRWSLGPLTLAHELARVVACEQLYRAFTILRGERYHK
ncbi:MAG TPA: 23S rRNA (pseudouridine(1915)-N(3))-methyltransferase RlmH [Gemmatimonadales bacterium]|jgi:23S rRNA (pseudouridine1915-N3)-methyltransferase|nr:23S rRNA (pseudouridine(1915)-N(3))-methyltransferase RlmH [Gemmatimonadales bacterium]